jgi:hypothetical protein
MSQTNKNQVFKYFIALCAVISLFIIYFLVNRPAKLILEVVDQDEQTLEFTYQVSEHNPDFQKIIDRSNDGSHVILVLLTKNLRTMKNTSYDVLIEAYNKCNKQLPCPLFKMDRDEYLKLAKKRKY